jgi:small subunit ribosomal protein S6
MRLYESIVIGRQDLSQQQMEALGVSLCLFVAQNGGAVVRSEYCGFRNLAYPIEKNHKGHYYIIQMKADSSLVAELLRIMKINEDIIRQLIVKVDEFDDKENLISQAKTSNDDYMGAKDTGYRNTSNRTIVQEEDKVEQTENEVRE